MITKAQVKHIRSLDDKKNRIESSEFIVEGEKMMNELIHSTIDIKEIYALPEWVLQYSKFLPNGICIHTLNQSELERISFLSTPNKVLAIATLKKFSPMLTFNVALLLDTIQDPGNMGTIIRIADWFGIEQIICSGPCADPFSPKVVQSSMGGVFRVPINFINGVDFLNQHQTKPSFAATLNGRPLHEVEKINDGIIVIGNESKGISENIIQLCKYNVTIPKLGGAESLNVAVATGIICHSLLC